MFLLYGLLAVVGLLWLYFRKAYSYWATRNVFTPTYTYFFGNLGKSLTFQKSIGYIHTELYGKFKGKRYIGFYKFMEPSILVRSPELYYAMAVTNFSSFHDNDFMADDSDPLFGKNPFVLKGHQWKKTRNQIIPNFSSGKMKALMPILKRTQKKMVEYLMKQNGKDIEAYDGLTTRYTSENVATCAFGIDGLSFEDKPSDFHEMGKKMVEPSFFNAMKFTLITVLPKLSQLLKVRFSTEEVVDFFSKIVRDNIEYRKKNNIKVNDYLDAVLELEAKINDPKEFNFNDMLSHIGSFFIDGYITSALVMSYILYELAANPDVQEQLREDLEKMLEDNKGDYTFDSIMELTYLDYIVKEGLRMHPPLLSLLKICTEDFKLPPMNEDDSGPEIVLEKGTPIAIPTYSFHMDERFFPEAERFNPNRWSDESNHVKGSYSPFGLGPRMCLGQKFGVLQMKMGIAELVMNFNLKVNKKTKEPLQLDMKQFMNMPLGGLWLNFEPRNKK